ncbi:hypothetical protein PINS_up010461 [Pythium insidiosum]|nr:hypothetical protein PINS_up010461 [Pythium insidiosum]
MPKRARASLSTSTLVVGATLALLHRCSVSADANVVRLETGALELRAISDSRQHGVPSSDAADPTTLIVARGATPRLEQSEICTAHAEIIKSLDEDACAWADWTSHHQYPHADTRERNASAQLQSQVESSVYEFASDDTSEDDNRVAAGPAPQSITDVLAAVQRVVALAIMAVWLFAC